MIGRWFLIARGKTQMGNVRGSSLIAAKGVRVFKRLGQVKRWYRGCQTELILKIDTKSSKNLNRALKYHLNYAT